MGVVATQDVDALLAVADGVRLEGYGLLAETLAAARADFVDTLQQLRAVAATLRHGVAMLQNTSPKA